MKAALIALATVLSAMSQAQTLAKNDPNMTGKRELQMMQCPSAVTGAATRVKDVPQGVEVAVTASPEWAQREIQRRAAVQQQVAAKKTRGTEEHTGEGTGSGRYGFCPGMLQNTTLKTVDTADGVRMVITADQPAQLATLRQTTRERAAKLHQTVDSAKR